MVCDEGYRRLVHQCFLHKMGGSGLQGLPRTKKPNLPVRAKAAANVKQAIQGAKESFGSKPTEAALWKSIRHKDVDRNTRYFLWMALHSLPPPKKKKKKREKGVELAAELAAGLPRDYLQMLRPAAYHAFIYLQALTGSGCHCWVRKKVSASRRQVEKVGHVTWWCGGLMSCYSVWRLHWTWLG